MTRAVQTISVLLLVSSVCYEVPPSQEHNPVDLTDNRPALPFPFPWTRSLE